MVGIPPSFRQKKLNTTYAHLFSRIDARGEDGGDVAVEGALQFRVDRKQPIQCRAFQRVQLRSVLVTGKFNEDSVTIHAD
jgi:hypothetical protein